MVMCIKRTQKGRRRIYQGYGFVKYEINLRHKSNQKSLLR